MDSGPQRRHRAMRLVMAATVATWLQAEDSDQPRAYFNFRAADTNPLTETHDLWGISLGMNLNRHLSVELAGDAFETELDNSAGQTLGEYAISAILPQARLRYPLFNDRFSPYLVGGAGYAVTQFNDRKQAGFHSTIDWESGTFVATLGAGFDYFFADNLAVGVDARYLYAPPQDYTVDGASYENDLSSVLLTLGLRVFFPELRPKELPTRLDPAPARLYLGVEFGGACLLDDQLGPGIELQDEPSSKGPFHQFVGARLGLDLGPHFGIELTGESFESTVSVDGLGPVGEYTICPILLQARARFPVGEGRFAPYFLAGAGGAYADYNDRKPAGENRNVEAESFGFAASAGVGLEYYLASNFSLDLQSKSLYAGGLSFQIDNQPAVRGSTDSLALLLGFRIHLLSFGRGKL